MTNLRMPLAFRSSSLAPLLGTALLASSLSVAPRAFAEEARQVGTTGESPAEQGRIEGTRTSSGLREFGPEATPPRTPPPLAGYHQGVFYLRDARDRFRLYPMGRLYTDALVTLGRGVADLPQGSSLSPGIFIRRGRLELAAEAGPFQVLIMGEFGPSGVDNPAGRTDTLDCSTTIRARQCDERASTIAATPSRAAIVNAFVNYAGFGPWLNLLIGQVRVPFGLENRTGDGSTPFLERSIPARISALGTGREIGIMAWGEARNRWFNWAIGVFDGDGSDRVNVDESFDAVGRVYVRPWVSGGDRWFRELQFGISARHGKRDSRLVGYDFTPMTTQGGYAFFRPTYRDAGGRLIHLIPNGLQHVGGLELYLPVGHVDIASEVFYHALEMREAVDGFQIGSPSERAGIITGPAAYVQVGYWFLGTRDIIARPGTFGPVHLDLTRVRETPEMGLQGLVRYEHIDLFYDPSSRAGVDDPNSPRGHILVQAFSLGVNYWYTRHVRLTVNWQTMVFPDSAPAAASAAGHPVQTSVQRATAPAQLLPKGVNDPARDGAHIMHELGARVGMQF